MFGGRLGAMEISLDRQVVRQECEACQAAFQVVRGAVYDAGAPIGLYLAALHGHAARGAVAHLGISIIDQDRGPVAAALDAVGTPEQVTFAIVDWNHSPWRGEAYLGTMLDREAVLNESLKGVFFHVAEHVVADLDEVRAYLA